MLSYSSLSLNSLLGTLSFNLTPHILILLSRVKNIKQNWTQSLASNGSVSIYSLYVCEFQGMYFVSCVLLMRMNMPIEYRWVLCSDVCKMCCVLLRMDDLMPNSRSLFISCIHTNKIMSIHNTKGNILAFFTDEIKMVIIFLWWGTGMVTCPELVANDCIWSSCCHYHPIISCFINIQNSLPFWCQLTQVVLKKGQ